MWHGLHVQKCSSVFMTIYFEDGGIQTMSAGCTKQAYNKESSYVSTPSHKACLFWEFGCTTALMLNSVVRCKEASRPDRSNPVTASLTPFTHFARSATQQWRSKLFVSCRQSEPSLSAHDQGFWLLSLHIQCTYNSFIIIIYTVTAVYLASIISHSL